MLRTARMRFEDVIESVSDTRAEPRPAPETFKMKIKIKTLNHISIITTSKITLTKTMARKIIEGVFVWLANGLAF